MSDQDNQVPKKKKKKGKNYFGQNEEEAVKQFLASNKKEEREEIYRNCLKEPIEKMVESIINRYKLYNSEMSYEDLFHDTISFLNEKIHLYNPTKGRAYSYFGTIVRRRLQTNLLQIQKKNNLLTSYSDTYNCFADDESLAEQNHIENDTLDKLFYEMIDIIKKILEENEISGFLKEKERVVGYAVIEIMEKKDEIVHEDIPGELIENKKYAKAHILKCLRSLTNYSTKDITSSLTYYKEVYRNHKQAFIKKNE